MLEVLTIWEGLKTHDPAYLEQNFQPNSQPPLSQRFAKNNKVSQKRKLLRLPHLSTEKTGKSVQQRGTLNNFQPLLAIMK